MPGPQRAPTAILALRGSWRAKTRGAASGEPEFAAVTPPAPVHLDAVAREVWDRLAALLAGAGVLTEADVPAFESLCTAFSRWREAEAQLDKDGLTIQMVTEHGSRTVAHPAASIALSYRAEFRALCDRFGITPSQRSKVAAVKLKAGAPPESATRSVS